MSPGESWIASSFILFSSIIISSPGPSIGGSIGGFPINGVAPETVIVLTLTLSATTTVNITSFVVSDVVKRKLLKLEVNDDMVGPEVSVLVMVIVSVDVEEFPCVSVAVKV